MRNKLIVQKFGGSSVSSIERIKNAALRALSYAKKGYKLVIVVSAMGDTTDELIDLSSQITKNPNPREMDMLLSTGEQVSSALLAMSLQKLGLKAISLTGWQSGIASEDVHGKARIIKITPKRIEEELKHNKIVVVTGFQGINSKEDIATLGRGGSDLSAVALAYALDAKICEIYTDVNGIYTTDPRIEPKAKKIKQITYDEMLEMASLGAQVMQARSILFAKKFGVTIHVRSSLNKKAGTVILREAKMLEESVVSAVTLNQSEAKITICDVPDKPGIAATIFKEISKEGVNVDMIVQNVSRASTTDLSFTVSKGELKRALRTSRKAANKIGAGKVFFDSDIARVSIVGVGMRSHSGIASKMFEILADNNINIEMISTSEISISCIIQKKFGKKAVQVLHDKFGLGVKQ
ncbi:MAG: aspartate kinase [Candidatus Omnitrophota bacterium]